MSVSAPPPHFIHKGSKEKSPDQHHFYLWASQWSCAYMCVYIYIHMCRCVYIYIYMYVYASVSTYICPHAYTCTQVEINTWYMEICHTRTLQSKNGCRVDGHFSCYPGSPAVLEANVSQVFEATIWQSPVPSVAGLLLKSLI